MPAVGRNPFTSDEDKLLVKYLAKYNPGVKGRSGNRVYKALVENEHNKWSWSSSHPWGGWRERYTKNQSEFDRRIKAYQKKHGMPTENPIWINGTQKPKGSDVEDEVIPESSKLKRKRESSAEARKRAKVVRQRVEDSDSEVNEVSATAADPIFDPPPHPRPRHLPRHRSPGRFRLPAV
ncbi:hypothetical protein DFH08DRAFT_2440 [Mycena albidolilacea]|uniref:TERF2-interacting telomeric protein 1 Myb domain-containing protein n=1 Tax=Mycena albidolilacea TaxID=1033008 RepID=A0AAD7AU37_9AGAR|nr:hypothetical protein DFH08DRAFT_2440 [Mycena albidolilacea]